MPRLELHRYREDDEYSQRISNGVASGIVCGFCIFKGSANEAKQITAELQELSFRTNRKHLLFSCDAEWGLPMRLGGTVTEFPHALALARSKYPNAVYEAAFAIAEEMKELGIHWNFAPVADVNSDPDNPIINIRSFGDNVDDVTTSARAYARGMHDCGIIATAKHFPGHGQTKVDSHRALPVLHEPPSHFEDIELPPFEALIESKVPSIMTGHLAAPALACSLGATNDSELLPASLSPYLTRKLLRDKLKFESVIITDSMEMAAVKATYPDEELAAEMALRAGNDIVLMPNSFEKVYEHLKEKSLNDDLFTKQLIESAERVEQLVLQYLPKQRTSPDLAAHQALAENIAYAAIDYTGDAKAIKNLKHISVLCDDLVLQGEKKNILIDRLRQISGLKVIDSDLLTSEISTECGLFILDRPRGRLLDQSDEQAVVSPIINFLNIAKESEFAFPCIFLVGNPYLKIGMLSQVGGCVVRTYSDSAPSIKALTKWIGSIR
ncbi:MAG TPA: glycoside hydrolase family 3 protein [Candidatus Kapabacteria bacterium]|nr:glycoside hydrolase family 3 protein [Candidatus Kapabacteria bacterium]